MPEGSGPSIYRIDDIEVDAIRAVVSRGGVEVPLQPKAFRVLVHFLQNPDRLIAKEELLDLFWKDTAVTDDALTQCIAYVRRALGDTHRNPAYLKTVPRMGYRFVGTVTEVPVRETPAEPAPRSRRPFLRAVAVLLAVSLGGGAYWVAAPGPIPTVGAKRQIAVVRFDNLSGQADLDWLRDGLPDMLDTTLSRSLAFEVLSREQVNSRLRTSNQAESGSDLERARATRASVVIAGSFSMLGESMRVDARATDANGAILAAENMTVDRKEQLLSQLDFLGARLAARLAPRSQDRDRRQLSSLMTDNLEAYRYYSLGLEKAESLQTPEAIALLEKALALDPSFVMAQARIGYAYAVPGAYPGKGRPYLEKAFRAAARLTEKDRQHILAWYSIANQDYDRAIRAYSELIAAYPNEEEAYFRLAMLLRGESRHEEAAELLRHANAMDPDDPKIYNALSSVSSEMGRHSDAIAMAERYIALAPSDANAYDSLALSYQSAGQFDDALEAYRKALELDPAFRIASLHRGLLYAQMGRVRDGVRESLRNTGAGLGDRDRRRGWDQAAWIDWRFRHWDAARSEAEQALKIPIDGWVNSNPAYLLIRTIDFQLPATSVVGRGGKFGSRHQYYFLAEQARLRGRPEDRLDMLRQMLRVRTAWSDMEPREDALGEAYFELGRTDDAIVEYERALRVFPGMALARFHLALSYQRRGRTAEAKAQFQQFLALWKHADSDLHELAEARRAL